MSGVKLFYKPVEIQTVKSTPTIMPTPTIDLNFPLQNLLPYQGDRFVINKYTEAKVLQVTTKRTDKTKIKTEIAKWLTDNSVSIEGMSIDWK